MTLPRATMRSIGSGHYSGPLQGHPGGLEAYVMLHTANEANIGLWHVADAPYTHRTLCGGGLLTRGHDGLWRGAVAEGRATWWVDGTLAELTFRETADAGAA